MGGMVPEAGKIHNMMQQPGPYYGLSQANAFAEMQSAIARAKKDRKYAKQLTDQAMSMFKGAFGQYQRDIGSLRDYSQGGMLPFEREADAYSLGRIRAQSKTQRNRIVQSLGSRLGRTGAVVQGLLGREDTYAPQLAQDYLKNMSIQRGLQRYGALGDVAQLSGAGAQLPLGIGSLAAPYVGQSSNLTLGSMQGMLGVGQNALNNFGLKLQKGSSVGNFKGGK